MRKLYFTPILATLTACATPYAGPTADIGSTFVALESLGSAGQELNPLANVAGLTGGAVISLGLRAGLMHYSRGTQECESVAGWTEAVGWGAACNNLAAAAGVAPQITLPLLAVCAVVVRKARHDDTAAWCGGYTLTDRPCRIGSLPEGTSTARCIDGRMALAGS